MKVIISIFLFISMGFNPLNAFDITIKNDCEYGHSIIVTEVLYLDDKKTTELNKTIEIHKSLKLENVSMVVIDDKQKTKLKILCNILTGPNKNFLDELACKKKKAKLDYSMMLPHSKIFKYLPGSYKEVDDLYIEREAVKSFR